MRFIRGDIETAAVYLGHLLDSHLRSGRKVLWVASGGSSVQVAARAQALVVEGADKDLTIMQIDERYGPRGHDNSNWRALEEAGLDLKKGKCIPILTGKAIDQTIDDYSEALKRELNRAEIKIGLLGIGADGHTAGILPGSRAVESRKLVESYQGPDFERITVTANVIQQLDEAVVYAAGHEKAKQLERLQSDLPPAEQPAQFLKLAKKLTIFSDILGEALKA